MSNHKTPLYDEHVKSGATMVPFGGWDMPVTYGSIINEHKQTRNSCSLFDVSHMGEIMVTGPDSTLYLESLIPTRMDKLYDGFSMYSAFCDDDGGVLDDLFVYRFSEESYMLVVNAGTLQGDLNHMQQNIKGDVTIEDITFKTAKLDIQGPQSIQVMDRVFPGQDIASLKRFHSMETTWEGETILVSQSGYTGEHGYELYVPWEKASDLWKDILSDPDTIKPAGLGARDSLRLESCYSLYGHELSRDISPVEAGIGWIVSSQQDYPGSSVLRSQKSQGAPRSSIALKCTGKGIPREGNPVFIKGKERGITTSGGFSPTLGTGIALALVSGTAEPGEPGEQAEIEVRGRKLPAEIVKKPFYPYAGQ